MLALLTILFLSARFAVAQDGASACNAVLQQGVYNIVSNSGSSASYAQVAQTMSNSVFRSETYDQYLASSTTDQRSAYNSWNVAAGAFGYSLSVGGSSGSSHLSESDYNSFQKQANAFSQSTSQASSSTSNAQNDFTSLIQTINPQVYTAYTSCLALYTTGIQFTNQNGYGSNSVFVNIKFVSQSWGASAALTGISIIPNGSAICTLYGDAGPTEKFFLKLAPAEVYAIACYSLNTANVDIITIAISTTQGTYVTYLYNQPPPSLIQQLQTQVNLQNQQLATLQNNVVPVGTVTDFIGTTAPKGYLICDGSSVAVASYGELFALIGTSFGRKDSGSFNLPDLRGRVTVGSGKSPGLSKRTLYDVGGEETHVLTEDELASHTHNDSGHSHPFQNPNLWGSSYNIGQAINNGLQTAAAGNGVSGYLLSFTIGSSQAKLEDAGSNVAHNNMQPFLVLTKIIKYCSLC